MITADKKRDKEKPPFIRSGGLRGQYERQLRRVAREIARIIEGFDMADPAALSGIQSSLEAYSRILRPWATKTAAAMLRSVELEDKKQWRRFAANLSTGLRQEILSAPTGRALRELMEENVHLITSLPIEAAERAHALILENMTAEAARASEIAAQIRATGEVTAGRATLIARTEIARAASGLTEVRAKHVGSEAYVWRTLGDSDVRPSHRRMEGKVIRWDDPPEINEGTAKKPRMIRHHAGATWNCRCYPQPVIPEREYANA